MRLDVGSRLYACLGAWEPSAELRQALTDAGYEVADVADAGQLGERIEPGEAVLVVVHVDVLGGQLVHAVADLQQARPDARLVLIGTIESPERLMAAISAGVVGFCPAEAGVDAVLRTLDDVRSIGLAIPRSMVAPIVDQLRDGRGRRVRTAAGPVQVTEREYQILQLLLQRRTTQEMAETLFVSVGTVRSHISVLLHKIGATDREDAIAMLERGGH